MTYIDHLDRAAFAKRTFQYDNFYNCDKGNDGVDGDNSRLVIIDLQQKK